MEYIKTHTPKSLEKGYDIAGKPLTPLSERPRSTWGSLEMSLQTVRGLCTRGVKCFKKDGHAKDCWPEDKSLHGARGTGGSNGR